MKNLQEIISEIKLMFNYDVQVKVQEETYPTNFYWIEVIVKIETLSTYELRKLSDITEDYWIKISAIRKGIIKLTIMIAKESK